MAIIPCPSCDKQISSRKILRLAAAMTDGTTTTCVVLYSYKAMGQDGSTAGDPIKVRIEQPSLFEVGL